MPKLSFKVPEESSAPAEESDSHVVSLGLLAVVAVIAVVSLVTLFDDAMVTGLQVANVCGPNALVADNQWYVDQLERLGYKCSQSKQTGVWCCVK
ncbi:hypothetical protein HY490_01090 [Candidatus Woesearchaeota archaeon]|nr:hypothetical protein [Candidatus Woesearchaeota archaeon]